MFRSPSSKAAAAVALAHAVGSLACGSVHAQTAAAQAGGDQLPRFDVEAYDVAGNTLLEPEAIEEAVYDYLGPGRSASDIQSAAKALEDTYHRRGFDSVVVQVPQQTVADRVVRLDVEETTVGRLKVSGTRFYSIEDVKRQTPALTEGAVPNFQTAQQEIAELNRQPGRQVTPLVQPGQVPGTVDIELHVVEQEPLHASLEVNNDHPADTTPLRATASIHFDNLWQAGHTVSLSYAFAPQDMRQSQVIAGSYLAPVPSSRWSLMLYGYNSNSHVATLGDVAVLGKGYAIGVRGIDQLPQIGPFSQTLSFGFDFKNFDQLISTSAGSAAPTEAAVDYWPLTAAYTLQADDAASTSRINLTVTAGVRDTSREEAVFQVNRANARSNFVHLNLDFEHTRTLPKDFVADVRLTAQAANGPMLSAEQFSAGGLSSVRGYLQSSAVGDEGLFGSVELRSPTLDLAPRRYLSNFRVYAFADSAQVWLLQPLAEQQSNFRLLSAGLGARFQVLQRLDGNVLVAWPFAPQRGTDVGRGYTQFSLKAGF
jgi:hemolysin activation/secretion protein